MGVGVKFYLSMIVAAVITFSGILMYDVHAEEFQFQQDEIVFEESEFQLPSDAVPI